MNYQIDKKNHTPAYIQLYHYLVNDIVSGVYPYESKLPSKRTIAVETGVSVITVEHAIMLLNEEGYVQTRERSGVYVIYRDEDFLGEIGSQDTAELAGKGKVSVIGGFPYSILTKTMRRVMLDYGERILVKSPNPGCIELRSEICHYLARSRGINVEPSQVIVGSGAEHLYGLIAQMLGEKRIIAIEDPSYIKIRRVYAAMGIRCDLLSMTTDGIATEALERTEADVLHITPFNSFPTGVTAGISKKREYLRWAKKRQGILIEDNYDSEMTVSKKVEEPLFSMDPDVDVIYVNTFSRTLSPSIRTGYMILPTWQVKAFDQKLGFYSCTVPVFEQYVLTELLKNGDFERHLNRVRRQRRNDKNN